MKANPKCAQILNLCERALPQGNSRIVESLGDRFENNSGTISEYEVFFAVRLMAPRGKSLM